MACKMNYWWVFLLMQCYCLSSVAASVVLQGAGVWYGAFFSYLPNVYFYAFCLLFFLLPSNWKNFGWKLWVKTAFTGLVDVAANTILTIAYSYTSLASITMLCCINIPTAMLLSFFLLRTRFNWIQVCCALFAIIAAILFTVVDQLSVSSDFTPRQQLIGDILAIFSTALIGANSVLNEIFSAGLTTFQYIPRLSISAFIVSLIIFFTKEYELAQQARWEVQLLIVAYGILVMLMYLIAIVVLQHSSATFYLVSYLPVNIYAFIASIVIFNTQFMWYIIFPILGIIAGVLLYQYGEQKMNQTKEKEISDAKAIELFEPQSVETIAVSESNQSIQLDAENKQVVEEQQE